MRIISCKYKSRILNSPKDNNKIRPTTDRARETLFNILSNKIDFENLICLDLFCGSGSFGLECLSRGASFVHFIDKNIILAQQNINKLDVQNQSVLYKTDAIRFLTQQKDINADIAFADPPYKFSDYGDLLKEIMKFKLLFILEHSDNLLLHEDFREYLFLQKKIGITYFSFFDFKSELL